MVSLTLEPDTGSKSRRLMRAVVVVFIALVAYWSAVGGLAELLALG